MIKSQRLHSQDEVLQTDLFKPEAMVRLGHAFASMMKRDWTDTDRKPCHIERIGLVAPSDAGKSVFVRGLMCAYKDAITLEDMSENPYLGKTRPQKLYQTVETGFIRLTDAQFYHINDYSLPSFESAFLESGKVDGVDLVENADLDYAEPGFDAVWHFNRNANARRRVLTLYATEDFRSKPALDSFKAEVAAIKAEIA